MLIINNISKNMKKHSVLKNINLIFEEGHVYTNSGENGSGKTMLLRAMSGLIRIQEALSRIMIKFLVKILIFYQG
ncbi:ATP-binding cassette domain-containing protein [Enterococcus termitis]